MHSIVTIVHVSAVVTAAVILAACLVGWIRTQSNLQREHRLP
ncbi:hypothetical protein [Rosistilla oblonga]